MLVRDVLGQLCQEIECIEYLEVPAWPTSQVSAGCSRETMTLLFLRAVEDRTIFGELYDPSHGMCQ